MYIIIYIYVYIHIVFFSNANLPEVRIGDEVPAVVTPLKPKYYLLGNLSIPARTAVKIL